MFSKWWMSRPHTCRFLKMWSVVTFLETTSHDGILLKTLQVSSIMPHLAYIWMRLLASWTFDSNPLWMICSWPHMPSSSAPILAHAISTTTKAIGLGNKLSYCILGNRSNTSCSCPHFTSHYYNIPRDHIMWGHLVEHSQSLLCAPTLGIHVNEATPYKTIWLTTTLNDLLISKPALFKCQ